MTSMMRNFILGAAVLLAAGNASAATIQVIEEPAGDEHVTTLNSGVDFQVIYALNVCPLSPGDTLVVTSQSQVQNSSVTHDILFAAQLRRDTPAGTVGNGISMDNEGNGMNIAPHDYRLVSPKVVITKVGSSQLETSSCVIKYLGRADSTQGGSMSVVGDRGRLQVLKITP